MTKILDEQFAIEKAAIATEIKSLQTQLQAIREQIRQLGFVGNISKEFLDRHSELKAEIDALKIQNQAFLTQKELQDVKAKAEEALRRSIEGILAEIEEALNVKMKEFNDTLFKTHSPPISNLISTTAINLKHRMILALAQTIKE